ncbi:MAG: hypothetical protein V4678_00790 [Patescibacteria group bacterium]
MRQKYGAKGLIGAFFLLSVVISPVASANTPSSTNFRFDETSIGLTNSAESSSTNFRDQSTAGGAAAGPSSSANFQTQIGSNTSPDPNLTFTLNSPAANFGSFSPTAASTSTASFSITNYTSYGYVVQIAGKSPTYANNEIDAMSASAASQPGTEQFGINLVANTTPVSFGSNPQNGTAPNDFGFGQAAPSYANPNTFRYVPGETIAQAPKSSGKTDYTISYVVNVANLTPGGTYGSDQVLIVTGTY